MLAAATLALTAASRLSPRLPGDVAIARAVQDFHPPLLGGVYGAENALGSGLPPLLLAAAVTVALLLARRLDLLALWLLVNALRPLDGALKQFAGRPRPSPSLVRVSEHASGLGFPSGHVFTVVLLCGAVAALTESLPLARPVRRLFQAVCLVFGLLMGPARVYSGAHWPSDALGGYLWGALLLSAALFALRASRPRPSSPR